MLRDLSGNEKKFFASLLSSLGMGGKRAPEALECLGLPGWKMALLPDGAGLGKATFADLAAVAKACGDTELVIADTYSPEPNQRLVACEVDYYEFKNALASNADFTSFDVSVVGRSGRWLAVLRGLAVGFIVAEAKVMDSGEIFGPGLRH